MYYMQQIQPTVVNSRNKTGVWSSEPCKQLRKDKVVQRAQSEMHATAVERERLAIAFTSDGGIVQAFQTTVSLQKKAISGSIRILYWLAKEEIAHFTKFDSLRKLCLDLGCDYFRELNMSGNAKYNSHRMIEEWLTILSNITEEDLLKQIQLSPAIGLMCDESTYFCNQGINFVCSHYCRWKSIYTFLKAHLYSTWQSRNYRKGLTLFPR